MAQDAFEYDSIYLDPPLVVVDYYLIEYFKFKYFLPDPEPMIRKALKAGKDCGHIRSEEI